MKNKDTILLLLRVLYKDENVIIRHKINKTAIQKTAPYYAMVIKQGIKEGVFTLPFPDEAGEMLMEIIINSNEAISRLILQKSDKTKKLAKIRQRMKMFTHTIEKTLGVHTGAFHGFDVKQVNEILSVISGKKEE